MFCISVYRLEDGVDGSPMSVALAVDLRKAGPPSSPSEGAPDGGTLLFKARDESKIDWIRWLGTGFDVPRAHTKLPGAVLVLHVTIGPEKCWFAVTFGQGHYLLRPEAVVPSWGIRTAINILHRAPGDAEQLRRVDARALAGSRMHVARQAPATTDIGAFDLDVRSDLLRGLTGTPRDPKKWGGTIKGSDAVTVGVDIPVGQLAGICEALQAQHDLSHYADRFKWIDYIVPIRAPQARAPLMASVLNRLRARSRSADLTLNLCPPDLVDWDGLSFRYTGVGRNVQEALELDDYLRLLAAAPTEGGHSNKLADLSEEMIRRNHKVVALRNGAEVGRWSILLCLDGELIAGGETFVIAGGEFYKVDASFVDETAAYLRDRIPLDRAWGANLRNLDEADYIKREVAGSDSAVLMDQKLVTPRGAPSPVEVCDIYESPRRFVHLKRKRRSATLSHLFNQALVSGQLMMRDETFRDQAITRVLAEEQTTIADRNSGAPFAAAELDPGTFRAADRTIVIGVLSKWGSQPWHDRLPFFSRVTLRRVHEELVSMGYDVKFAKIESPHD